MDSGSWWWTGRPGVLWFKGSQRIGHNWATELNWIEYWTICSIVSCSLTTTTTTTKIYIYILCMKRTPWNWLPESPFCFVLFIDRLPQDISWEQVCFAAPQAGWIWSGLRHVSQSLLRETSTRRQHLLLTRVNWEPEPKAKGLFLGCGLEWNVPGKNSLGLVSG